MPNYDIGYVRPAQMLLSLRDELNYVFPSRFTGTDGFVSGYGKLGISSHNANNLGHCMAFDISTAVNQLIDEPTGRALADYLRTKKSDLFSYLIHDMSEGFPAPKIAGNQTNWGWVNYAGDNHSDHIHISLTDDYKWGDSCGLSQSIYDQKVSWGIAEWYSRYKTGSVTPQGGEIKPIKEEGFLMALSNDEQKLILDRIKKYIDSPISAVPAKTLDTQIPRGGGQSGTTTPRSTFAWLDANLAGIREGMDPKAIAAAIPIDLAQQVIDALGQKLKPTV